MAKDSTQKYCESAEGLPKICDFVANGESLISFCSDKKLVYSKVINWIYDDEGRQKSYEGALNARGEWVAQRLLAELQKVAFVDVRKLFNDDGSIKDVSDLPDDVAAAIAGIDIQEAKYDKEGDEVEPRTRKIKLVDKLRSIEMLGKNLKMFTDKVEHTGQVTLEQLVIGSLEKPKERPEDAASEEEAAEAEKEKSEQEEDHGKVGSGESETEAEEAEPSDDEI